MDEDELTELQNQSVAVLAASAPRYALPPDATALLIAIPALCDEVRHLRAALHRMRDLGQGMSRSWYVREIDDGLDTGSTASANYDPASYMDAWRRDTGQ